MIRSGQRPFKTVEEMDRVCIQNWNCRVGPDDDIYIWAIFPCAARTMRWKF